MAKTRLDTLLAERGLFPTRSRAAASVLAGEVRLGAERRRAAKPGQLVADDVVVSVAQAPAFVSRGGRKLANALDATGVDPAGRLRLDVGASTGGFTDCLLQRGAAHVVALDVAYGELAWSLRGDERVTVMERVNARHLRADDLPYAPDLIVIDVVVHRARQGAAGRAGVRRGALRLPRALQAPVRGRARARRQGRRRARSRRPTSGAARRPQAAPAGSGVRCSGSRRPGCPGRRATARPSCGWPTARRPGVADLEAAAREVEP